jgi:phosphatidylserine/phosphatidylglycerophosphate/cardiolipin synthase-like enzyme
LQAQSKHGIEPASLSLGLLIRSGVAQTSNPIESPATPVHRDIPCRVAFSPGGGGIPLILAELEQARTRVDVAMFYFSSEALVKALCSLSAERGIPVRVLTGIDMDTTANRPVLERLQQHGVAVYVVSLAGSGRLHHKCAVVDGRVVLTGAANWSEAAELSNHEDVLALYSPELATRYLARFDEIQASGKRLKGPPPSKMSRRPNGRLPAPPRNLPGTPATADRVRAYYTPARQAILDDLIPLLKNARTVDVGMYLITDRELMDTLAQIASNAAVRLIVDSGAESGRGLGDLQALWDAGVQVASFHKDRASMHLKAVVIDGRHVWTGSANWTPTALDGNYEDVLWLDSPALANLYSQNLSDIIDISRSFESKALDLSAPDANRADLDFCTDLPATGPRTNFTDLGRVPFPAFEGTGRVAYLPDEKLQPALRKLIQTARQSIFIGMYVFSEQKSAAPFTEEVVRDLEAAARRGVYVYMVLYTPPGTADRLDEHHSNRAERLRRAGIDVRLALPTVPLHMKTVVVDLTKVIVGSHNWSEGALSGKRVYESSALIILDAQEPKLADFILSRQTISDMRSRDLWRQEITTLRHLTQSSGSARDDLLEQLEGVE